MKKLFITLIALLLLAISFSLGFFVKKSVDDKKFYFYNLEQEYLKNKINRFAEDNYKLSKSVNHMKTEFDKNWLELSEDIYLDKKSITINKYSISGWFKMYNTENTFNDNINGVPVFYQLIKYEADCNNPTLCLIHIKQYDKNDNILSDEPNNYDVCYNGAGGWINGEIAYNALCKFEKN